MSAGTFFGHKTILFKNMKNKLIYISSEFCGPCKMQSALLKEMEKAGELSEVHFEKYIAEDSEEIVNKYNVKSVPTLIFESERETKIFTGIQNKEKIKSLLETQASLSDLS